MSGPIGHYVNLMVSGALWRLGERYTRLVLALVIVRLLVRHAGLVVAGVFGVYVWIETGTFVGLVVGSALVYALVFLGRAALAYRRGSARGLRAILTQMARASTFRAEWPETAAYVGLTARSVRGAVPPLGQITIRQHGVAVLVAHGRVGKTGRDLNKAADGIRVRCDAARARVVEVPGHSALSTLYLDWGEHLRQTWSLADLKRIVDLYGVPLGRIPWGVSEDGPPATSVLVESKLLGALTGGGKSSWIWAYLWGMLDQGIWPRIWALDPKGIELAALGEHAGKGGIVHRYENNIARMTGDRAHEPGGFWHDLAKAMRDREAAVRSAGLRSVTPSEQWRPNLVLVDEWLAIADDVRKRGTAHPIAQTAWRGRAVLYTAIAATQAAQVDVAGRWRDLVPERIAFATPNKAGTDAILGDSADSDGARASELDPLHDAGVCYLGVAGQRGYMSARSAYVVDAEIKDIAAGRLPELLAGEVEYKATHVYVAVLIEPITVSGRAWPTGTIAYVGITQQVPQQRWNQHVRESGKWWAAKCEWSVLITYPRLSLAADREDVEIGRLCPLFNDRMNRGNPDRVDWKTEVPS